MATLQEILENIKDKADEADQKVNGSASGGLSEQDKLYIHERLDAIESDITLILNPDKPPTLDPPNAGVIDMTVPTNSLTVCADQTALLATAAHTESLSGAPNQSFIGTKIKTIKGRVLNPYRTFIDNA